MVVLRYALLLLAACAFYLSFSVPPGNAPGTYDESDSAPYESTPAVSTPVLVAAAKVPAIRSLSSWLYFCSVKRHCPRHPDCGTRGPFFSRSLTILDGSLRC